MRKRALVAPGATPLCVQVYVPAVVYVVAVTGPQRLPVNVVAVEVWQLMEVCEGEGQQLSLMSDMLGKEWPSYRCDRSGRRDSRVAWLIRSNSCSHGVRSNSCSKGSISWRACSNLKRAIVSK